MYNNYNPMLIEYDTFNQISKETLQEEEYNSQILSLEFYKINQTGWFKKKRKSTFKEEKEEIFDDIVKYKNLVMKQNNIFDFMVSWGLLVSRFSPNFLKKKKYANNLFNGLDHYNKSLSKELHSQMECFVMIIELNK